MKDKKIIIAILAAIVALLLILSVIAYNKNNTEILQGEVDVKSVDLSSKIAGRIEKINVKKGDTVNKGDVLIILDTPDIDAKAKQQDATLELAMAQEQKAINGARKEQINMARNSLNLAKKTYDRLNNLHTEGVIPTQKLDEAYAQYKTAQDNYSMLIAGSRAEDKLSAIANVKKAQGAVLEVNSYLKENKIIAPISGEITEITVEEGELTGAGYPIVTIVDNSDNWFTFNMREDLLSKVKNGTQLNIVIPALGNKTVEAKVNYISVLGNFATFRATKTKGDFDMKTFEVRAIPTEKNPDLRAGMSAILDWDKIK